MEKEVQGLPSARLMCNTPCVVHAWVQRRKDYAKQSESHKEAFNAGWKTIRLQKSHYQTDKTFESPDDPTWRGDFFDDRGKQIL
jgi:hypothetical protein